jgi:cytoskeletal protein CcmA (bactofilin family)
MKTSVIPAGVKLVGEIEGRGELVVAGVVEGPIEIEGTLTIEEGGEVRGDVSATTICVRGVLAGTATAADAIRVEASAIVVGDARAPRVQIVEGARFRGRVQMSSEVAASIAPRRRRSRDVRPAEPSGLREARLEPLAGGEKETLTAAPAEPSDQQLATPPVPERPRKRRRDRRPPPPHIPAMQRQTARRKDRAPSSEPS